MDSKCDLRNNAFGCKEAIATSNGNLKADIQSSLQLTSVSIASESSAPNIVYQRRKLLKGPPTFPWTPVSTNMPSDAVHFVYERRKHKRCALNRFSTAVLANKLPDSACTSAIRSEEPSSASPEKTRDSYEREATIVSSVSEIVSNIEQPLTTDVKDKMDKTVELHSVDDSCSSSMLCMDVGSGPLKTGIDDTDECSSSGALVGDVMGDNLSLSAKDLCIAILRSHGLLSVSGPNRSVASEGDTPSCSGSSCYRPCNVCGFVATAEDLLICDECEEAFHISCCNPSIRKIPIDSWYCQSCFKKKHRMIKKTAIRKSSIIRSGKGTATCEGDLSPIALMLKDSEPYTTGVRVGKGFQAIVPEWSGPITEDNDFVSEPMELNLSSSVNVPGLISSKRPKSNFIGNWLQCREVITGFGEGIDGTVCGKWRRAPLFEVQTDNWDCFRSVLWDPTYADCAVPQELDTEQVLKQLRYIEMLRPRLEAKKRKLELCKANGFLVSTEDTINYTDSTKAMG